MTGMKGASELRRILTAALLIVFVGASQCHARELERPQRTSKDQAELIDVAHKVVALIDAGQFDELQGFAATPISLALETTAFLKHAQEILLERKDKLDILVERDVANAADVFSDGRVVRLYFYDPSKIKLKIPLSRNHQQQWMTLFVTCLFVKTGDGWRIYRTPFESETDGPTSSGYDGR